MILLGRPFNLDTFTSAMLINHSFFAHFSSSGVRFLLSAVLTARVADSTIPFLLVGDDPSRAARSDAMDTRPQSGGIRGTHRSWHDVSQSTSSMLARHSKSAASHSCSGSRGCELTSGSSCTLLGAAKSFPL